MKHMLIMAALCVIGAALPAFRAYYYRTSKDGKVHGFAHRDCFPEGNAVLIASPVTDPATVSEQDRRDIEACEIDPRVKEPTDYEYAVEEASKYVGENRALSATDPEAREAAAKNNEAAKELDPLRQAQEAQRQANAAENNRTARGQAPPDPNATPKEQRKTILEGLSAKELRELGKPLDLTWPAVGVKKEVMVDAILAVEFPEEQK